LLFEDFWYEECRCINVAFLSTTLTAHAQKNKSAKVQKQVQILQQQQAMSGKSKEALAKEKEKELREKAKREEEKRMKEEAALFKPIQTQKVPFGVDPKTVLCVFYKAGNCEKGNKCKFSHDINVGRKVEKKNLYEDGREDKMAGMVVVTSSHRCLNLMLFSDTMENWDEEKLRNVVLSKHGNPRTTTDVRGDTSPFGPVLNVRADRVQILYRGYRDSKVR